MNHNKYIVIINGSGKCGTSSLHRSFSNIFLTQHSHGLLSNPDHGPGPFHGQKVLDCILKKQDCTFILIDSYRDFLDRKMSSFFQNLEQNVKMGKWNILKKYKAEGIDFLLDKFNNDFLENGENYISSHRWTFLGYDFYEHEFDFENKYQYFHINNYHFIHLRFKDIKQWTQIIKNIEFFNDEELNNKMKRFKLFHQNSGTTKWYAGIYAEFKQKLTLTQHQVDQLYNTHQISIEHFYNEQEREELRNKWLSRVG